MAHITPTGDYFKNGILDDIRMDIKEATVLTPERVQELIESINELQSIEVPAGWYGRTIKTLKSSLDLLAGLQEYIKRRVEEDMITTNEVIELTERIVNAQKNCLDLLDKTLKNTDLVEEAGLDALDA
jgi:hypothetical protein